MNKNKLILSVITFSVVLFSGCSSVPLEPKEISNQAKTFAKPSSGQAGIYVYRDTFGGQSLKKDVLIDNKCLGETANKVFFYKRVKGDTEHTISTESEFSNNTITLMTKSGKNYYIRQYIKMGLFVGGAGLEVVDEKDAQEDISGLDMAVPGHCDQ